MLRETLTAALSDFEAKSPVDDWIFMDWHAWPAIRNYLALSLHERSKLGPVPSRGAVLRGVLAGRRRRLARWLGQKLNERGPDSPVDALFVTRTDRGQPFAGGLTNTVVDPWVDEVQRAGRRAAVWDLGDPRRGAASTHVSVQYAIDAKARRVRAQACGPAPVWFGALAAFAHDTLAADVGWDEIGRELASIEGLAALFAPWLEGARPRVVVLDCWYLREMMAVALAAHRLCIPTIDLQHGIQGSAHPAYAGWSPGALERYELMPDDFWVWGDWDADSLVRSNPGAIPEHRVHAVGHRWLHAWVEEESRAHRAVVRKARHHVAGAHSVCVTLQKGVAFREILAPLVRRAPSDWRWLVRLHRSMSENPRRLEQALRSELGPNVDVVAATELPLYALLAVSTWHVTGFSTCALEALAFGVPTLLTHESGAHAYAEFIDEGVMHSFRSVEESVALLAQCCALRSESCKRSGARVFAPPAIEGPWSPPRAKK